MKKKILKLLLMITLSVCLASSVLLNACSVTDNGRIKVVCTIFPEYDWVREISDGVDGVSIDMLLDSGIDLHSYQPSVKDVAEISSCDLFIYVGGESDGWVTGALNNAKNPNRKVINLLELLKDNLKEEEIIEGMQPEEGEEEEEEEEETEYDEHVWLSIKNASIVSEKIASVLSEIDTENANAYSVNLSRYKNELNKLDENYQKAVNSGTKDTLLFGDRFPFRYLTEDYNLKYYAAFVGCSAESEASFETIKFLAKKVDDLSLPVILTIEGDNNKIAQTIQQATTAKNQKILVMDSMQSVTSKDLKKGITYLSVMENNLISLNEALK